MAEVSVDDIQLPDYSDLNFKIADSAETAFGRRELIIAEQEMPGLMALREKYAGKNLFNNARITGSLHMTVQTAVLIETLKELVDITVDENEDGE